MGIASLVRPASCAAKSWPVRSCDRWRRAMFVQVLAISRFRMQRSCSAPSMRRAAYIGPSSSSAFANTTGAIRDPAGCISRASCAPHPAPQHFPSEIIRVRWALSAQRGSKDICVGSGGKTLGTEGCAARWVVRVHRVERCSFHVCAREKGVWG